MNQLHARTVVEYLSRKGELTDVLREACSLYGFELVIDDDVAHRLHAQSAEQPGSSVQGEAVDDTVSILGNVVFEDDWFARFMVEGVMFLAPLDLKDKAHLILSAKKRRTTPPPAPAAEQGDANADRWVAIKPEGAPYWGIHTEAGATIAGTSSGLGERDAKRIVALHNNELSEADDLLRELGLDPARFRSEGGWLNAGKVRAALLHPQDYAGLYLTKPGHS